MKTWFSEYEDGTRFCLHAGMEPNAPSLHFCIRRGYLLKYREKPAADKSFRKRRYSDKRPPDLEITFKSIDDAFLVFTGQLGIAASYAQHRFFMRGNPNEATGLVDCMELAEAYLFPRPLSKRLMLHVPEKQFPMLLVYMSVLVPSN